jgi:hypothetical protein
MSSEGDNFVATVFFPPWLDFFAGGSPLVFVTFPARVMLPESLLLAFLRGRPLAGFTASSFVPTVSGWGSLSAIVSGASAAFFAFRRGLLKGIGLLVSEVESFLVDRFLGFVTSSVHLVLAVGVGKNRERV